jgi:hypothetical protein
MEPVEEPSNFDTQKDTIRKQTSKNHKNCNFPKFLFKNCERIYLERDFPEDSDSRQQIEQGEFVTQTK